MTQLCDVKKYGHYGYVVEDPDPKYSRIFIENQAFDLETLTPRTGEFFEFQSPAGQTIPAEGANLSDTPVIYTQGKFGNSWSATKNGGFGGLGRLDPWLNILDYNFKVSRILYNTDPEVGKEQTPYSMVFYPRDINANDLRMDLWSGTSMSGPASYRALTSGASFTPVYERDDGVWVGINTDNNATGIFILNAGQAAFTWTQIRNTASIMTFFIGLDVNNCGYFVEVHCGNHAYNIYKHGDKGTADLVHGPIAGALTNVIYQFPSNIKNSSNNRKVFYSSHFTAGNILAPKRFVFNSLTGDITSTDCTMTYPGANTYNTYATVPAYLLANYDTAGSNVYWMKPHVFTKQGTSYITFCTLEKSIANFSAERWTTNLSRTWVTYTIGTGENDYQLTYHSSFVWNSTNAFPRSWVPTTTAADELFIVQTGTVCTLTFNTTTGWVSSNIQNLDVRAYGQDSLGRIYCITRGDESATSATLSGTTADAVLAKGYNQIHLYNNNNTKNVDVTMDSSIYSYTGTTIPAVCSVLVTDNDVEMSNIFSIGRSGNTTTIVTSTIHGLTSGNIIDVLTNNSLFNQYNAVVTVIDANTFNYFNPGLNVAASTSVSGTIKKPGALVSKQIKLSIVGDSMTFDDDSKETIITTSTSGPSNVPVNIISTGQSYITATNI